ncbi:SAM domain-containing protein [Hirschfeldia incana]|nr:SAM domain-containing protein [Hirschfeldia incana]
MAELQHLVEAHNTNGGLGFIPPPPAIINSAEAPETSAGTKRLRRPSVRLGDIGGGGDQYQHAPPYDSPHARRPQFNNRKESGKSSSRTRALTNLSSSGGYENNAGALGGEDPISIGTWRVNKWVKASSGETTAGAKRVRSSNWARKEDEELEEEEGFRDFSREDSESPTEEEENRTRYENRGRGREGVKIWLQELGLGRYWPMFEMHEVDEEVLPLLTVEDLKDMGINAVGSRRKMFCALQKLGREFS